MSDQNIQQLIYRAGRWPWRWFKIFREAAAIAEREQCKFNVLREEFHLLKLEASELHKQRVGDAERHQTLRDDHQALKLELSNLQQLLPELKALKEERTTLVNEHKLAKEGVRVLYEFIRRNQVTDSRGKAIPEISMFPNIFRNPSGNGLDVGEVRK